MGPGLMVAENGVVTEPLEQATVNIDELAGQTVHLEVPGRVEGVPEVRATVPRRVDLPDGEHYIMVLGGGSNRERVWLQAVQQRAVEFRKDGMSSERAEMWVMAQWATFVADRVTAHNFEYAPGDPMAVGLDLVWELGYLDSMALIGTIQTPPRFFADPKASAPSSTSSSNGASSQPRSESTSSSDESAP